MLKSLLGRKVKGSNLGSKTPAQVSIVMQNGSRTRAQYTHFHSAEFERAKKNVRKNFTV